MATIVAKGDFPEKGGDWAILKVNTRGYGISILEPHIEDVKSHTIVEHFRSDGMDENGKGSPEKRSRGIFLGVRKKEVRVAMAIRPGDSGGPLVLEDGRIIGIASAGYFPAGIPYAHFTPLKQVVDRLNILDQTEDKR